MMGSMWERLLGWYEGHKRELPWRGTRDAYAIWVSEIMLQQTRVAAVLGYYARFMERFPAVEDLARASEAEVLAAWSGLGYYRRARMMHRAAKVVVKDEGKFPESAAGLRELPGIGAYTAAAIASIAFGEAVGVVDGNVERVFARVTGRVLSRRECQKLADEWVARDRPGDWNQAVMELGATVCTPRVPRCMECPLVERCATRGEHAVEPQAERRKAEVDHLLRRSGQKVLLRQRARELSLMAGMWELPVLAHGEGEAVLRVRHSITNTDYVVRVFAAGEERRGGVRRWVAVEELGALPLTGLTRKILRRMGVLAVTN